MLDILVIDVGHFSRCYLIEDVIKLRYWEMK